MKLSWPQIDVVNSVPKLSGSSYQNILCSFPGGYVSPVVYEDIRASTNAAIDLQEQKLYLIQILAQQDDFGNLFDPHHHIWCEDGLQEIFAR